MKYGKIGAGCLAVVLCLGTMPVTAWAGTPEFAYTAAGIHRDSGFDSCIQ